MHGFLSADSRKVGERINGLPVIGRYDDLRASQSGIDIVFVCLPPEDEQWAEKMFEFLATTMVEVKGPAGPCV